MDKTTQTYIEWIKATDLRDKLPTNTTGYTFRNRDVNRLEGMAFHQALSWGTIEQIHKYHTGPNHMDKNGLSRISYTVGIRRNGEVCMLNDLETKTWSQGYRNRAGDENAEFIGVMFEGMFSWGKETEYLGQRLGEPTEHQIASALQVWNDSADFFNWDCRDIYGHFDFGKESCPGRTIEAIIRGIRTQYDFDVTKERTRFLKAYEFKDTTAFQESVNRSGFGVKIGVDGVWGARETIPAAYWWIQHHPPVF